MKRPVVTVDGLAGSGKTVLSKGLAEELGFAHLSSGVLYRAVGYLALKNSIPFNDSAALLAAINSSKLELLQPSNASRPGILVGGDQVVNELYSLEADDAASQVSVHADVREALIPAQREAFAGKGLVAEGRDMGTVVFADAALKFFVESPAELRVERRMMQLYPEVEDMDPEEAKRLKNRIKIEVLERDRRDSERELSPTVAAADAQIILNDGQPLTQVIKNMYTLVAERGLS